MLELPYLRNPPSVPIPKFHPLPDRTVLAWNEWGDPDGAPVLFYHGWPASRLQARLTHHLAKERGLRIIAPDRPGIGCSNLVKNRRLLDWPPMLEHFLDRLGIGRFMQLGVSGGGPYVLATADALGDRVAASAVLAGAVPLALTGTVGLHPVYRLLIPIRNLPPAALLPIVALGRFLARGESGRAPLRWLLRTLPDVDQEVLRSNPQAMPVFLASFREAVRQGPAGPVADADIYFQDWGIDPRRDRPEIVYWHGAQDGNVPLDLALAFVKTLRHADIRVDEKLGHFSLVLARAPEAMDYLRRRMRNEERGISSCSAGRAGKAK